MVAVHQDVTGNTMDIALAYAAGIGEPEQGTKTTFKEKQKQIYLESKQFYVVGLQNLLKLDLRYW